MQNILSFNTVFSDINIILQKSKNIKIFKNFKNQKQSEILVSSVNETLNENDLNYNNIDVYSSIIGPGNFTGIKTSLAVLKAIQISTNKKIITNNLFEIISFKNKYDIIILDLNSVKYYIEERDNYYVIYKKDLNDFLKNKENYIILTNDLTINAKNIIHSEFTNDKWLELINYKAKNKIFTEDIKPLYIEEVTITKRKNS